MPQARKDCPCCSEKPYADCCEQLLNSHKPAATAVALMRSRYSAYVQQNEAYLLKTWHPATRPRALTFEPNQKWIGLRILNTGSAGDAPNALPDRATVEFIARFRMGGRAQRLHEVSQFVRVGQYWLYLSGEIKPAKSR